MEKYEKKLVAGEGFEPSKAEPGDLQSPPIGRSGNPPGLSDEAASVDYPTASKVIQSA